MTDVAQSLTHSVVAGTATGTGCLSCNRACSSHDVVARVQEHILALPAEVLATPFGALLQPSLGGLQAQLREAHQPASAADSLTINPTPSPVVASQPAGTEAGDFAGAIRAATAGAAAAVRADGRAADFVGRAAAGAARGYPNPVQAAPEAEPAAHEEHAGQSAAGERSTGSAANLAVGGVSDTTAAQLRNPATTPPAVADIGGRGVDPGGASSLKTGGPRAAGSAGGADSSRGAGGSGSAEAAAVAKRAFEAAVRAEFARLMSGGDMSPNDAAALAVRRAAAARA